MLLCRHITGSSSILVSIPAFHMPIHFIGTGIKMPVTLFNVRYFVIKRFHNPRYNYSP